MSNLDSLKGSDIGGYFDVCCLNQLLEFNQPHYSEVSAVGDCDNVSERNGAKNRVFGTVSRVLVDTSNGMVLRGKERSREVRTYADVTRKNI